MVLRVCYRVCLLLPLLAISACVAGGYSFQKYETVSPATYRLDRMAFRSSAIKGIEKEVCAVEVYSRFYDLGGKLGACGRLIDNCKGEMSAELTQAWFDAATLHLAGDTISSAAFYGLNLSGAGAGQANCVVTEIDWNAKYAHARPYFEGGRVTVSQ